MTHLTGATYPLCDTIAFVPELIGDPNCSISLMDMAAPLPKRELPTTSAGAASPEVEPAIDKEFATMVCCCWSVVACVHVARPKEGCDGGSAGWGCDGVVLEGPPRGISAREATQQGACV